MLLICLLLTLNVVGCAKRADNPIKETSVTILEDGTSLYKKGAPSKNVLIELKDETKR